MNKFLNALKISSILSVFFILITCIIYPFVVYAFGEIFCSFQTNGSLIQNTNKQIIGSLLIGQNFTKDYYFHPRPSAAGEKGYDAMRSGGSNLGPTSQKFVDSVKQRAENYRKTNDISANVPIPIDPLTASGSGLDPHISTQNALLQATRVAKSRSIPLNSLIELIENSVEEPFLGIFGSKRINVLLLNKKLDAIAPLPR